MKFHIYHHLDADGYCAAATLLRYFLNKIDRKDILTYSCVHSSEMNFSNVDTGDVVFIVDYSFPDCDKEGLKKLYETTTKEIYWIDHHKTTDNIISESKVFEEFAENGLVETSNLYAGCLLTYLWCMMHRLSDQNEILINKTSSEHIHRFLYEKNTRTISLNVPKWIRLVSDHDTFRHEINGSMDFVTGLSAYGLTSVFIDPESKLSFVNRYQNDDSMIDTICNTGKNINDYNEKRNKSLVERNSFDVMFQFVDQETNNSEWYNVTCINGYGNSTVFGEKYNTSDAVCIFDYDGCVYAYSMYARDDSKIDCSAVALYFKKRYHLNGGGHLHAAGWSAPVNIFEHEEMIEILIDHHID